MILGIIRFFAEVYILLLIFRGVLTQQELVFNPLGRIVGSATDPLFKGINKAKAFTDKLIPGAVFVISTGYAAIHSSFFGFSLYTFLDGYQTILDFLFMFSFCTLILGVFSSSSYSSFPLYFYRLGSIWVKPVRKIIPIKSNYIIIPSLIFLMAVYAGITMLLNINAIGPMFLRLTGIKIVSMFITLMRYYSYILIIRVLFSWISPDPRSAFVQIIFYLTEPVLSKIRKIVPSLGVIDITPMAAFALIYVIQMLLVNLINVIKGL